MPSTVGSVARSFAFCGPALGMKGRKSQPLRIRESLGQSRRNEDALPEAGCIWGLGKGRGRHLWKSVCAKGIPTQGGQNRWGVSTTARAWEDQAGGAQSPSSLPFSLMCSFFPRWAASARPWLLPPATCGFCMASTCHGAHTSPNQTARSFFSRSPQNIDFSSNTPSTWAVRVRRSPLNQADVPGSEVTWYRHGCLGSLPSSRESCACKEHLYLEGG